MARGWRGSLLPAIRQALRRELPGLAGLALLLWLGGPLVALVVVAGTLAARRRRRRRRGPGGRRPLALLLALLVLPGLPVLGYALAPTLGVALPLPPGTGRWVTPAYEGRPLEPGPLRGVPAAPGSAPIGDSPVVRSRWQPGCAPLAVHGADPAARALALCGAGADAPRLESLDDAASPTAATTLRPAASGGDCAGAAAVRPDGRLAVGVGRSVRIVRTDPLADEGGSDLADLLDPDDCVRDVVLDPRGRTWFASAAGVVGLLDGPGDPVATLRLRASVPQGFAAPDPRSPDRVELATADGVVALGVAPGPRLRVAWRRDDVRGPGARPVGLPPATPGGPGLLAVLDAASQRPGVVVLDRRTGVERCRLELFDADGDPAAPGLGLVPLDPTGAAGPAAIAVDARRWSTASTLLGRAPRGGVARIDVGPDPEAAGRLRCAQTWSTVLPAAPIAPVVAPAVGLAYVVDARRSAWGAQAWGVSLLDLRTGTRTVRVRVGLGEAARPTGPLLRAGRGLVLGVRGGLVTLRDLRADVPQG
ncbi:hypothetical protein K8Z61_14830 [Nocardioides sp. TRM66260-LWL]|uniref:hypothetical protein n=1 Tax=Nocardioides sp. TRM66260-LWL TaxID=2874478 RepID=UPI001CC512D8|nr:hypothetical protein [Nocardioides sp. TRM66260-LWL]MBZ5735766.1 hypothetical protein [Nocardioides sp. TRM66260-LWL]